MSFFQLRFVVLTLFLSALALRVEFSDLPPPLAEELALAVEEGRVSGETIAALRAGEPQEVFIEFDHTDIRQSANGIRDAAGGGRLIPQTLVISSETNSVA
jgi:hypothetical protein